MGNGSQPAVRVKSKAIQVTFRFVTEIRGRLNKGHLNMIGLSVLSDSVMIYSNFIMSAIIRLCPNFLPIKHPTGDNYCDFFICIESHIKYIIRTEVFSVITSIVMRLGRR